MCTSKIERGGFLMAEKKLTTKKAYDSEVKSLIKEYKAAGTIHYDVLTNKIATPFSLNAEKMDQLIQTVEDAGVGVVGDACCRSRSS